MRASVRLAVSCALILGVFLLLQFRSAGEAVPIRKPLDTLPAALGDWEQRQSTLLETEIINYLKVSDYLMRRYTDPTGRSVWLYVGYWSTQRKGADFHSPRNCLPAGGWEPVEASRLTISVPGRGEPITINRYLIQKDREMQVVLYWYQSQGKVVASEVSAKMEMVRNAIFRNRTDGALVRVSSPVSGTVAETADRLVRYVQVLYPALSAHLPD